VDDQHTIIVILHDYCGCKTMKTDMLNEFNRQLGDIIADYRDLVSKSQYDDASDSPAYEIQNLLARSISAVERVTGLNSVYSRQIKDVNERHKGDIFRLHPTIGIVMALKSELESGYLETIEQIIHADLFSDYLEMAGHLIKEGYKDPAAVLAGSTLEVHLRKLANLHDVEVDVVKRGKHVPKKSDRLNADLTKAGAYTKLDQKSITAWLALRNHAAHGRYDEYLSDQVVLMISGIGDFISRIPA